ncbi:sulfurtransferase TusA family protein [Acetonema longum]|uniref:SirA family protein n=1 Tax=Acetonema longum DSM 6540 TaxID=1009370 RepID=F7NEW5_9FIRM|nr:sulfurtransferase TusA family protein [Acetonema longum]EGO65526.1 SirA family protein [Acetonema longum DSM 6540]
MATEKILDLRGLSCPIPLLETKKALEKIQSVKVIVDETVPKENILKFVRSQNYHADCSENGGEYTILIHKP